MDWIQIYKDKVTEDWKKGEYILTRYGTERSSIKNWTLSQHMGHILGIFPWEYNIEQAANLAEEIISQFLILKGDWNYR